MKKLSVVIPAYNEEKFIGKLLEEIKKIDLKPFGFEKEIVVVDDGSSDKTYEVASAHLGEGDILIKQDNAGKGRAVQHGIKKSTGDFIIVQDADLEYFPRDYRVMMEALNKGGADVVYGSRVLAQIQDRGWLSWLPGKHPSQSFGPWMAGAILSLWTYLLYGTWIYDTLTGYKVYPRELFDKIEVKTKGFETDHELTAKIIKLGMSIDEVPVDYMPRSKEEGKKISAVDGFKAVATFFRFRFFN